MATADYQARLQRLIDEYNQGNLAVFDELLIREYFDYAPYPEEPTAPQSFKEVGGDLREAFPDLQVSLADLTAVGDELRGKMTLHGTHTGSLWGFPATGKEFTVTTTAVARFEGDRLALRWEDLNLVGMLREIGVAPMPEEAHLKPKHAIYFPEIIQRLAFNGSQMQEKECAHLHLIQVTEPKTDVCEQCVASGDEWPALRMCLVCGFVGCCNVSVNKHILQHYEETGHPIVRSIHLNERWIWCQGDNAFFSSRHLPG